MRILAAAVLVCGCGGEVVGSVDGHSLNVAEAALVVYGGSPPGMTIWLSDRAGLCNAITKNEVSRNQNLLSFSFLRINDEQKATVEFDPGSYAITPPQADPISVPGRYSQSKFTNVDNGCVVTLVPDRARAASGIVTIDSIDLLKAKRAEGSFNVTYGGGDRLTGTFDAPVCQAEIPTTAPSCN